MQPTSGIPPSGRLVFTALRNGSRLGTHSVGFARAGDALTIDLDVDYAVKLGFVTVFRYRLRARETWVGGVLTSATADTDNNGTPAFMRARRDGDALLVEGSQVKPYRTPPGALIASHWNQGQLNVPLVNPQDGGLIRFTVEKRGAAKVADSAGTQHDAQRFFLAGNAPMDLWYGTDGTWRSLQATVADKSVITYLPMA
jgi:hypothetical protein